MLDAHDAGTTLAAALRRRMPGKSWADVRRLCATGKVRLDGELALDPAARVSPGARLAVVMNAPRPRVEVVGFRVAFEDGHLVIIEKPAGVTSVPYERKDAGTALDLIRAHWRHAGKRATATPLYTVHRLDKDTSGLLCFAKTRLAERALHEVFQRHTARREYLAVAEGAVESRRIESSLVADRGDGIRGSTRTPGSGPARRHPRHGGAPPSRGRDARAACASRPGARTRSASTSPRRATRSSARRSTSAICCARAGTPCRRRASCCTRRRWGCRTPSRASPSICARRRRPDFIDDARGARRLARGF